MREEEGKCPVLEVSAMYSFTSTGGEFFEGLVVTQEGPWVTVMRRHKPEDVRLINLHNVFEITIHVD